MKIRHDPVALSSLIFTVALLILARSMFNFAEGTHQTRFRDLASDEEVSIAGDQVLDGVVIPNWTAPLGIASLTIIAIGLVVTWTGYIKGIRWTYFVMFVIVWLWAFPVQMLPLIRQEYPIWRDVAQVLAHSWIPLVKGAIVRNGLERALLEPVVTFLLMVLALILPLKKFFMGGGMSQQGPAARM